MSVPGVAACHVLPVCHTSSKHCLCQRQTCLGAAVGLHMVQVGEVLTEGCVTALPPQLVTVMLLALQALSLILRVSCLASSCLPENTKGL